MSCIVSSSKVSYQLMDCIQKHLIKKQLKQTVLPYLFIASLRLPHFQYSIRSHFRHFSFVTSPCVFHGLGLRIVHSAYYPRLVRQCFGPTLLSSRIDTLTHAMVFIGAQPLADYGVVSSHSNVSSIHSPKTTPLRNFTFPRS